MRILDKLYDDHRRMEALADELDGIVLARWEKSRPVWGAELEARTLSLVQDLVALWSDHMQLDRDVLYPRLLRAAPMGPSCLTDLESERAEVDALLSDFALELSRCSDRPTPWMLLNLMRLTSLLQRHVRVAEEELFPLAQRHLAAGDLAL